MVKANKDTFKERIIKMQKLIHHIEELAPVNKKGGLPAPFCEWRKELRRDIAQAEKWIGNS